MTYWTKWKGGKFKITIKYNRKKELYKSLNAKMKGAEK